MPLYEYRCQGCSERFEVLQRLGEDGHGLLCPRCGAAAPERVLSTFAAHSGTATRGGEAACDAGPSCCGGGCFPAAS